MKVKYLCRVGLGDPELHPFSLTLPLCHGAAGNSLSLRVNRAQFENLPLIVLFIKIDLKGYRSLFSKGKGDMDDYPYINQNLLQGHKELGETPQLLSWWYVPDI